MTGRDNSYTLNRIRMKHVHIYIVKIMYFSNNYKACRYRIARGAGTKTISDRFFELARADLKVDRHISDRFLCYSL